MSVTRMPPPAVDAALRVDAACLAFEAAWRAGRSPRLEEYFDRVPPDDRAALFEELLRLEIELRFAAGPAPDAADLYRRFPAETARVAAVWQEVATSSPLPGGPVGTPPPAADDVPAAVGRYRVEELLGAGAFGRVFRAADPDLRRAVAVKLSHQAALSRPGAYDAFLAEARALARVDHPGVVPVYDVGRTADGRVYLVVKLIEGSTLADRIRQGRPDPRQAAAWVAAAAAALHAAHRLGLVHRDVKPTNLLLDAAGSIYVSDFGLVLREEDADAGPALVGTPAYMSPEQARGEGHRVDARSDVFALGVVLYELLTGRRPFPGDSRRQIFEQVLTSDPRPPRQLDRRVPRDLERACLRALAKRAADRFDSALDLAAELRRCLDAGAAAVPRAHFPLRVVPRGLRSFAAEDAEFFLGLLPGPRDADGLPKSIRFWKRRAESRAEDAFPVGLLYGPSGCGKSSLVKAGLLPRLADHVVPVALEASTDDTEDRLLAALRRRFPALAAATLPDAFAALRRGAVLPPGRKLFLVIDQFEQWLHGRPDPAAADLTRALRQCDGPHVQCLLLVRDDFWLAASRFMHELEVPIVEDRNCALVDLFDARHARSVLAAFGQSYGALPDNPAEWTRDQEAFLDEAVAGLASDGKVVCVRLALFAEMVKGKAWSPKLLEAVGGPEGVGESFLEETFASRTAPPEYRAHEAGARAVLAALLPGAGVDIKGHLRTAGELKEAAGYAGRPAEFAALLDLLDARQHLIAPAERAGGAADPAGRCYQLTHDYLVPSLRGWLTRGQRATPRGRAELCLAERAAWWVARPHPRLLPTAWEWLTIRLRTRPGRWADAERRLMRRADRYYLGRTAAALALLVGLTAAGLTALWQRRAADFADRLAAADTKDVPAIVARADRYRSWAGPRLAAVAADPDAAPRPRLHAALALLPSDPRQLDFLRVQLLGADPATFLVIRDALAPHAPALAPGLWDLAASADTPPDRRVRAAFALAAWGPVDPSRWAGVAPAVARRLAAAVAETPRDFAAWAEAARPARAALTAPLEAVAADGGRGEPERLMAASLLLELAGDQPEVLGRLLLAADAKRFAAVLPAAARRAADVAPFLSLEADPPPAAATPGRMAEEPEKDRRAARQANAALALFRLGHEAAVWPLLRHTPEPRARSYLIDRFAAYGEDPRRLADRLAAEPDVTIRRALLLALGEYEPAALPAPDRGRVEEHVRALYRTDPDPGVHGAAEWLLRRWGRVEQPPADRRTPTDGRPGWYVDGQGNTMAVVPGPAEFRMGVIVSKTDQEPRWRTARVPRTFAIATKEVTVAQYARFLGMPAVGGDMPHSGSTWYDAARYCNWLSRSEGVPEDQWCYAPARAKDGAEVMEVVPGPEARTGYRLPTEAEWDYACRAGSVTPRYYGYAPELLPKYAWYIANSDERQQPVGRLKPNDLGLFDMYGNLWEWCQDPANEPGKTSARGPSAPELIVRGAPFMARDWFIYSSWRSAGFAPAGLEVTGFRVARTMPAVVEAGAAPRADPALRVLCGGFSTCSGWLCQTGAREATYVRDPEIGRAGFRVVRTAARD